MAIEIKYLPREEGLIRRVAAWMFTEFGPHNPEATSEGTLALVRERVESRRVPLCLVAFREGAPVGTASIFWDDMRTHPELQPWLGDLVVPPEHRRQGIGTALFQRAEEEFQRLHVKTGYLFTWDHEPLYLRLGWQTIKQERYRNDLVSIMKRDFDLKPPR